MTEDGTRDVPSSVAIVGAGLGGWRTATELRRFGYTGQVTVVGGEDEAPYDRPPLSKSFLASCDDARAPFLTEPDAARDQGIDLLLGQIATQVLPGEVVLAGGARIHAEALVVATGARPRRPAMIQDVGDVHVLRTLEDARRLRVSLDGASRLAVLGGGFIGAEVASTAADRGIAVDIVELQDELFAGVLGSDLGAVLRERHEARGVRVIRGRSVVSLSSDGGELRAGLDDGSVVNADVALVGFGAQLNTEALRGLQDDLSGGLLCNRFGAVAGQDRVWAVGDVARWWDQVAGEAVRREHWSSASAQATVVARALSGLEPVEDIEIPYVWSDQAGTKLQVVGWPELADESRWLERAPGAQVARGYYRRGAMVAAAVVGAPRLLARMRKEVAEAVKLADLARGGS